MSDDRVRVEFSGENLSFVWAEIVAALAEPSVAELSPIFVSVTGFDDSGAPRENDAIRARLDELLRAQDDYDTELVAFTIFPRDYWLMSAGDRDEFFELCRESFLRIKHYAPERNSRGLYFQRLVDFEGNGDGLNQLKVILDEYNQRPDTRRSKWQVTTFDPHRDLTSAGQLGFPCLQQISFTPEGDDGLSVNAFYATQQVLRKGYGNYLGLCRLGAFVAGQMKRQLVRLNVFVGVAQMREPKKKGIVPEVLAVWQTESAKHSEPVAGVTA